MSEAIKRPAKTTVELQPLANNYLIKVVFKDVSIMLLVLPKDNDDDVFVVEKTIAGYGEDTSRCEIGDKILVNPQGYVQQDVPSNQQSREKIKNYYTKLNRSELGEATKATPNVDIVAYFVIPEHEITAKYI